MTRLEQQLRFIDIIQRGLETSTSPSALVGIWSGEHAWSFAAGISDLRLGLEVAVIQMFANKIVTLLKERDPLSEKVHLKSLQLLGYSVAGITAEMLRRSVRRKPVSNSAAGA